MSNGHVAPGYGDVGDGLDVVFSQDGELEGLVGRKLGRGGDAGNAGGGEAGGGQSCGEGLDAHFWFCVFV